MITEAPALDPEQIAADLDAMTAKSVGLAVGFHILEDGRVLQLKIVESVGWSAAFD